MAQKKKLQVFVSSTYTDLRAERQAAVEAILTAGHIPAGMELFAAGDESQMHVIKRWIDESDVYLLILGGRYGSIEPTSQKSYIQLEYEYAVAQGKPVAAVVIAEDYINERVKQLGVGAIETEHSQKLREFRAQVQTRMVRYWRHPLEIKLAIHETMADFSRREELIGWIPGSEAVNTGPLVEQLARVTKENDELREQVRKSSGGAATYNGITFEEMYRLLTMTAIDISGLEELYIKNINEIANAFGDNKPKLLHVFLLKSNYLQLGAFISPSSAEFSLVFKIDSLGLIEQHEEVKGPSAEKITYVLTEEGKKFLARLRLEPGFEKAEQFILPI